MVTTTTPATKKENGVAAPAVEDGPLMLAKGLVAKPELMRQAAEKLGIEIPTGDDADVELLGALRQKFRILQKPIPAKDRLRCDECMEFSTDVTTFCPFCGDDGIDDTEVKAEVVTPRVGIASVPTAAPSKDVEIDLKGLETELDGELGKLNTLRENTIECTYEMGIIIKRIHDRTLFRARGYKDFKSFAEKELSITRQTAYQLVALVEQYDKKTFKTVGFRKLKAISALDIGDRKELLAEAKGGAGARSIETKVSEKLAAKGGGSTRPALPPKKAALKSEPPPAEGKVTLLAKLDAKPKTVKMKSAKSGSELKTAGKISFYVADAFAEIEVAENVYLRVSPHVVGKDFVGLTVQFVRAAEAAE